MDGGDYTFALEQFGDLAAIATVADIVSLTGENRFIVRNGLQLIENTDKPALIALKEVCGFGNKKLDSYSIGFGIGPRINAAGRYGSPSTAMELFLSETYEDALPIANELNRLINSRRESENAIISEIYDIFDKNPQLLRQRVICVCGKGWHHGVIGIIASRVVEQFGKPCFIASEENGEFRGSARSFGDFSVFGALTYASEVLEKFGGHLGAGGFTIKANMGEEFGRLINQYALENHKEMPAYELSADYSLSPNQLTIENVQGLEVLQPFGCENEKPLFLIENAEITGIIPISNNIHSRINIKFGNMPFEAVKFRTSPDRLPVVRGDMCDMIVTLEINTYKGKSSLSLIISDIRRHDFPQDKFFNAINTYEAHMRNEELPQNYYPSMLPSRETAVAIYKMIPNEGINSEQLYLKICNKLNYCRFLFAVEAMKELGLITCSCSDSVLRRVAVTQKADFNSASVLNRLKEKISN